MSAIPAVKDSTCKMESVLLLAEKDTGQTAHSKFARNVKAVARHALMKQTSVNVILISSPGKNHVYYLPNAHQDPSPTLKTRHAKNVS
jgi:hypothetical protein